MTSIQHSSSPSPVKGANQASLATHQTLKETDAATPPSPSTQVSLSAEGKALLQALKEIDQEAPPVEKPKSFGDKVESFTHGALGLDPPKDDDDIDDATAKQEQDDDKDDSYTAGKYAKAAATIGTILLAVI